MPDANEVSEAIVVWSGFGERSWPHRDDASVVKRFGERRGLELVSAVKRLADEFYSSDAYATETTLQAAGRQAAAQFRADHPEVSAVAVEALTWCYTWDWK